MAPDSPRTADEEPVLFMLSALDTGISLAEVRFQPDIDGDDCVFSAFLTAMKYAVGLIFTRTFDAMRFGEYTMLLRTKPPFLLCYVFRGRADQSVCRLDEFVRVLMEKRPLLRSLENTIMTGAVDRSASSSIAQLASQVFAQSA